MINKVCPLLLAVLLTACAVAPSGRQQFTLVSPQQLSAMGSKSFAELKRSKPIETSRRTNAYVRCVAQAIVAQVGGRQGQWEVVVFRDKSANAFALPGGKIGVHTGLLKVTQNQDQLASVIGHEVAHVLSNHANERMSQQLAVQGGLGVLDAAIGSGAGSNQSLLGALGLGAQLGILLPYSRIHEEEADVFGLSLMSRAGFDPRQSVQLWQNMARSSGGRPPEFLSTHPSHGTRINGLQANMGRAMQTYEAARSQGKRPNCG